MCDRLADAGAVSPAPGLGMSHIKPRNPIFIVSMHARREYSARFICVQVNSRPYSGLQALDLVTDLESNKRVQLFAPVYSPQDPDDLAAMQDEARRDQILEIRM